MVNYFFKKEIPVIENTDVLVVGGGPAGIPAAIASARNGAKTILVEKNGCVGGMATVGLVGPFMTSYDTEGEMQIIKGIFDELVIRMEKMGGAIHPSKVRAGSSYSSFIVRGHDHVSPFDPEAFKVAAADMLQEAGVKLLLHSQFVDAIVEKDELKGIVIVNKSGMQAIYAAITIDCTGDADVAAYAGVPTYLGDKEHHKMQPATMFFRICNVDSEKVKKNIEENRHLMGMIKGKHLGAFNWKITEARERGEWKIERYAIGMYENVIPGEWRINTSRMLGVNGTSAEDLTRAEIEGRRQVLKIFEFMKKNIPGCENARLMDTGAVVGIRETRHIVGEYVMTKEDILEGHIFQDSITMASDAVDNHAKGDSSGGEYITVKNGKYYGIPYRSLVPLKVDNLLVAGRPVSATSDAASAIRVMPPCMGMGEAAGTAAALAVKDNIRPREIDVKKLRDTLKAQGVFLG